MARLNIAARNPVSTHEGGPAVPGLNAERQLRRSVLSCMLWEREFYEDGVSIADRIVEFSDKVPLETLAALAVEAREVFHLRHVPLLLLTELTRRGSGLTMRGNMGDYTVADVIDRVVQRADEMGELLAIHWRNGRKMVPAQMRKGLARAFTKFDEYQLAKYDRDGAVKLRDVLRMVRPRPADADQSALWKRVKDRTLAVPDTWEVALSGGADKKETFERLIREGNLGYFALLRNLRNMVQAGVDAHLVSEAIVARKNGAQRILPFRYVAAARAAPQFDPALDLALLAAIVEMPILSGKTIVLVDVSGSMEAQISAKSDLRRVDAAAALASILPGDVRVFAFSTWLKELPPRRGMAGVDAIIQLIGGGTQLGAAVRAINAEPHDRLIVISDEQSQDAVPDPVAPLAYMINVASARNGIGYGRWVHIDGFSDGVIRFIMEFEKGR